MRGKLSRLSLMTGMALLTAAGVMLLAHGSHAQHTPPGWPTTELHLNTPCFGGNICYVCPQTGGVACTAAQPGVGFAQGACQVGYPATKKCWDTVWGCGAEIDCGTGKATGPQCYNGPWCM